MKKIWLDGLQTIARDAGDSIMSFYRQGATQTWTKKDDSPLTEADLAAHHIIEAGLGELTPDIPVLSEESSEITWQQRQQWSTYWLVDPLDGTKEFIKQNGEFTVNIALIENNQPVMAVVYAPALQKMYFASTALSCYYQFAQEDVVSLDIAQTKAADIVRVVGSRSHPSPEMHGFCQQFSQVDIVPMGSSLKLCLIAQGLADIYPRLGPTMEWDTGAGHCIAICAGAKVVQLNGESLDYNNKESLLNPYFVVSNPNLSWS